MTHSTPITISWLLGWHNLVFLVPFAIALVYLGVYTMTGITFGDADTGPYADADVDAEAHVEPDVHGDAAGHDADHGQNDGSGHGHGRGAHLATTFSIASLVGVGRVPLSLVAMILLIAWGVGGFATVQYLRPSIADADRLGLVALPVAAAIAVVATAALSRGIARAMPMDERPTTSLPQLVGDDGVAVLAIDERFGLAKVRDGSGVSIQVPCRVAPGEPAIAADRAVRLMRFDRGERLFYVTTTDRLAALNGGAAAAAARGVT